MYNVSLQRVSLNNKKIIIHSGSNFSLNSIHGFTLVWKGKQYLKGIWGEVERKYSLTRFFCVSSRWVKIDTKMAARETREEEVMHDDWVLSPDFLSLIALGNVYSVGKRIESCSQGQLLTSTKWSAVIKRCSTPFKFADTYRLVPVNCHSFKSRLLLLKTHRH